MNTGTDSEATAADRPAETILIIRNFLPGQVVRLVFLTVEQARQLPAVPADALQIAVAPAGIN